MDAEARFHVYRDPPVGRLPISARTSFGAHQISNNSAHPNSIRIALPNILPFLNTNSQTHSNIDSQTKPNAHRYADPGPGHPNANTNDYTDLRSAWPAATPSL